MIARIRRGSDVRGLLAYLFGPGRHDEHTDPHLVAAWNGRPDTLEPPAGPGDRRDVQTLAGLLSQPLGLTHTAPDPYVWHCSLRAAPTDRRLSDAEWATAAGELLHRVGLARRGDEGACRWVAVRHADDHIHLAVVLARLDGHPVRLWRDYVRAREACRHIEDRYRLRATAPADHTATPSATRREVDDRARTGQPPPRARLRHEVRHAALTATDQAEFFTALQAAGLHVRHRHGRNGELTGYSVATKPDAHHYPGSHLAPDLSLPQLRARWATNPPPATRPTPASPAQAAATRLFSGPTDPAITAATTALRQATDQLRAGDDQDAAGIAHALADMLTATATTFEGRHGGPLTQAADRYDAAARTPHRITPRHGPTAQLLRATAAALAHADRPPLAGGVAQLIVAIAGVVAAIAAWRTDKRQRAQAAAARDTAQLLRTAAHTHTPGPPRTTRHAPTPGPANPHPHPPRPPHRR